MDTTGVEQREDYIDVEDDLGPRQSLMEELRSSMRQLQRLRGPEGEGTLDTVLRGIGQVVFQNNALTGLLLLLAIAVNSFVYTAAALFGALVSTYTAKLLRIDNRLVRDGLFGFNGALTGIAMVAFTSKETLHGDFPGLTVIACTALAAAFSTVVARAIAFIIRNDRVPGLNLPYCLATLLILGALHQFGGADSAPIARSLATGAPSTAGFAAYAPETWFYGVTTGIGQIFLQNNWLTGLVVVAAIAVNSRISAAAVIAGATVAVAICSLVGANEMLTRSGLPSYNAALTAIGLGGLFVLLDRAGALYAVLGAVLTTCAWAALSAVFGPAGLPVLTLPFVIVTWLMVVAARGFPALRVVPLEYAVSAERTIRRFAPKRRAQPEESATAADSAGV